MNFKEEIINSSNLINQYINKTPVLTSHAINEISGAELYFKCENFQKMGAFKMRGATNKILNLSEDERKNGVVTHSSGNYAQAVALASKKLGIKAYIVMPKNAPQVKKDVEQLKKQFKKDQDAIEAKQEDLQKQMLKMMDSTIDEVVTGEAEIMQIFEMRGERIAGVKVKTGILRKVDLLHLKRNDEIVLNPVIKSMMHGKQEVDEINTKNEGGLTFKNRKLDFQVGDTIIAYKIADE